MTMEAIFQMYTAGSQGFCIAVETHGGYEMSREEIERVGLKAVDANDFQRIWESENWWCDADRN